MGESLRVSHFVLEKGTTWLEVLKLSGLAQKVVSTPTLEVFRLVLPEKHLVEIL